MKLPMQISYTFHIHHADLSRLLKEVYRMDYDVKLATGQVSGMYLEYDVTGDLPDVWGIERQVANVRKGHRTRQMGLILNILCQDGFLPRGKYVIDLSDYPDPIARYEAALKETCEPTHTRCLKIRREWEHYPEYRMRMDFLDHYVRRCYVPQ